MKLLSIIIVSGLLVGLAGCSSSRNLVSSITVPTEKETSKSPRVTRLVCLWEPGVGRIPNGPQRGVLGQVLFFEGGSSTPTKVDGELTVYLFDDHGTPAEQAKPVQKLVLTSAELQQVHSEAALGHTYHIPVPYPKKHSLQTVCTMRAKYTSPAGEVAYSDLGTVLLDGSKRVASSMVVRNESRPASANAVGSTVQSDSGLTKGEIDEIIKRVGGAEIKQVAADSNQLRSLTIRRELPRKVTRQNVTTTPVSLPRKRFRLSNSRAEAGAYQDVTAADFAPLASESPAQSR